MIAILGTGKMGEALLSGLLEAGYPAADVAAVARGTPSRMPASTIASTRKYR